jgi:hypothetical protein
MPSIPMISRGRCLFLAGVCLLARSDGKPAKVPHTIQAVLAARRSSAPPIASCRVTSARAETRRRSPHRPFVKGGAERSQTCDIQRTNGPRVSRLAVPFTHRHQPVVEIVPNSQLSSSARHNSPTGLNASSSRNLTRRLHVSPGALPRWWRRRSSSSASSPRRHVLPHRHQPQAPRLGRGE